MWIRSQNREDLVDCHNLGLAYKEVYRDCVGDIDGYCICEFVGVDTHVKLGMYKTKERAMRVLDDIEDSLFFGRIAYEMPEE